LRDLTHGSNHGPISELPHKGGRNFNALTNFEKPCTPVRGKTYSLFTESHDPQRYYAEIKRLADMLLKLYPDEHKLLGLIRQAGKTSFLRVFTTTGPDRKALRFITQTLSHSLSIYTRDVSQHLKSLPASKKFDTTLTTTEEKYHLYMLEIELLNRIHREEFRRSEYKFALVAHCLRDFRPDCRSVKGDIEAVCRGCTEECMVRLGSVLLERYGIKTYISVEMEQERLFRKLKQEHPSIGALGIACIPELTMGMRLCIRTGIPPVGIPLNANRCARWMSQAHETSFSLEQLEELLT
jgi:hypothetical protein